MLGFAEKLIASLTKHGFQARLVSVSHLHQLQKEIESLHNAALLNDKFFKDRLAWFDFALPKNLPEAKSLIILAVPRPQTRAIFVWNGQRRPLILPPTYTGENETIEQVEAFLAKTLSKKGYKLAETKLPLKLLAARSGLVQYGRNNVSYISNLGSFFQLAAVYSDMACEMDSWQEAKTMKSCKECELCLRACPSGAIPTDRFLLRAERCIVYHNEKEGDVPFPRWMQVSWHNCIVGCMRCQKVCPENREFIKWIEEEEEFSEEETTLLLQGASQKTLPISTLRKLERLSLTDYLNCLPRNLSVFFHKAK